MRSEALMGSKVSGEVVLINGGSLLERMKAK